jgi:uncharacterized protein (DUF433 family)
MLVQPGAYMNGERQRLSVDEHWIVRDPQICGGQPVFKGTRVTLRTVLASLADGDSVEEILADFPSLTSENVQAAIAFAAASAEKGVSTDALVREALDKILADAPGPPDEAKRESRPIWDLILDNMKDVPPEEFARLPKDGASEHDHYLYEHPKRDQ